MMNIAIDIRKYDDLGIGTYIKNLVDKISESKSCQCIFIASPVQYSSLKNILTGDFVLDNSKKYSLRELFSVSKKINNLSVDLFHSPHYTLPYFVRRKCVTTIHDLIHLRMNKNFSILQKQYAGTMLRHACRRSDALITISEYTKRDILKSFDVDEQKIFPIHLGVHPSFSVHQEDSQKEQFRARYNIRKPFILYTGSLKPHKNVQLLIKSFHTLRKTQDLELVLTGEDPNHYPELMRMISTLGIESHCRSLGMISRSDLVTAYQSAELVVLPSLYEGFGFSMVEAMAAGTPAVGANVTSIPEIVGDAGLLFDPHDQDDLTEKISMILSDKRMRESLVAKGKERVQQFTWEECARKTIEVYRTVMG